MTTLRATWTEVANSRMDAVAPSPAPPGSAPIAGVISAWSGGAFDSVNNRQLVWGGGHGDSADNSVYAFRLASMNWARVFGPTANNIITASDGIESSGYYATTTGGGTPDTTRPRARHTYGLIAFSGGKMWSPCGVALYSAAGSSAELDAFDVSTDTWARVADSAPGDFNFDGAFCADASGNLWHYKGGGNTGYLWHYNIAGNSWVSHGDQFVDTEVLSADYVTSVFHPGTGRMYTFGGGRGVSWTLNPAAGAIVHTDRPTTGPQNIVNADGPGLAYHPGSGKIIGWAGGSTVYALDTATHTWAAIDLDPANAVTPPAAQANGTFGRFSYSAASDQFVLVNSASQNVLLLNLSATTPNRRLSMGVGGRLSIDRNKVAFQ